jgi:A/G-specific adenine glycosylase
MPTTLPAQSKNKSFSPKSRRALRRLLLAWYRRHARDLSWRKTRDPYAIWISEIMLQQTQVATVERYFPKFLQAFPTMDRLAAADQQQVLRHWEGLGYYRRARQLHAAAKQMVAEHGGQFPADVESLRSLPGIGRYTAGAILSIAFDVSAPILEANTVRLLSRLVGFRGDTSSREGQQLLWRTAEELVPSSHCGQFNQALMELGSLICTPRDPQCPHCPLSTVCAAYQKNLQNEIPAPRQKPLVENVREAAVVIVRRGKILLRQCAAGQRWAGLWDFPRFPFDKLIKPSPRGGLVAPDKTIINSVRQLTGMTIVEPQHFVTLRHSVTRFRITLDCFTATCNAAPPRRTANSATNGKTRWVKSAELDDYPLSTTGRKLARLWQERD